MNSLFLILIAVYGSHALSLHPVNFTQEEVEVDGRYVVVNFDGHKLSIEENPDVYDKPINRKNRVKFLLDRIYRRGMKKIDLGSMPTKPPEETMGQLLGCLGCGGVFLLAIIVVIATVCYWVVKTINAGVI